MTRQSTAATRLFETVSLGSPQNAVGFVLWRVVHRYQREIDQRLAPIDLTHLQFTTLILVAWLGQRGDPVNQSLLARFGEIQPMQVSHMLKTLEAKGMVARARSAADVRAKDIAVTAAGLKALRRALPVVIEVQQRLFGDDGKPGGALLGALLRADEAPSAP